VEAGTQIVVVEVVPGSSVAGAAEPDKGVSFVEGVKLVTYVDIVGHVVRGQTSPK